MSRRESLERAGVLLPREPGDAERAHEEARQAKLAERGKPHGLSADEVEWADRTRTPLERYAAMKTVRSPEDYLESLRSRK